jgi:hypothetical protein
MQFRSNFKLTKKKTHVFLTQKYQLDKLETQTKNLFGAAQAYRFVLLLSNFLFMFLIIFQKKSKKTTKIQNNAFLIYLYRFEHFQCHLRRI